MPTNKRIRIATIGCGNRARVYLSLISERPEHFEIVAAADPIPKRVESIKKMSKCQEFRAFTDADDLLSCPRIADVVIIATQDHYHLEPCVKALEKGYDIILEKPMCDNFSDIITLEKTAHKLNRRVIVCHVLRYTSFYNTLKEIVQSGTLGDVITAHATEGVGTWHFAHSYVRGHWAEIKKSTPTIVAKCCHDMDILHWVLDKTCHRVSSFGRLTFFTSENADKSEEYSMYDPKRYLDPDMKGWLSQVCDHPEGNHEDILEWLRQSNWGKSVFECSNTAVDHQVINLEFEDHTTATFTMTAFDEGRNYEINGTKARLRAGDFYRDNMDADVIITHHAHGNTVKMKITDQNPHPEFGSYHNGGDVGFVKALYNLLTNPETPLTSVTSSVHSHLMAFAAEEARRSGQVVELSKFYHTAKLSNALD